MAGDIEQTKGTGTISTAWEMVHRRSMLSLGCMLSSPGKQAYQPYNSLRVTELTDNTATLPYTSNHSAHKEKKYN